jgi:pyruvate ferredoxin oxidoreductase delta subunit
VKCGVCSVFCPEGCIKMQKDGLPLADMEYCKGCGICVVECWTGCISLTEEKD